MEGHLLFKNELSQHIWARRDVTGQAITMSDLIDEAVYCLAVNNLNIRKRVIQEYDKLLGEEGLKKGQVK